MMRRGCFTVLALAGFPLHSCGPDDDFKSVFNKAFFDQLQAADQAKPAVFQIGPQQPSTGREHELDQKLQSLVSGGGQPGFTFEIINEDAQPGPVRTEAVRELFPGPLQFEFGSGRGSAQSFQEPDPMIMDMLSTMDNVVQEVVAPVIHKTEPASMAPLSCQQEVSALCPKARSQVHCLGQNGATISEKCRKDVGKSVPFLCSGAIDRFCDILKAGILDCLHKHMDDLNSDCKDAVLATSKAISTLNAVNKAATPAPQALPARQPAAAVGQASADRERTLDSKLASLATKGPSVVSMIKEAERQAEDQLAKDADKIESLLSQMSQKMGPKPSTVSHAGHPPLGSWWTSPTALIVVMVMLALAYFFTQTDEGRKAWHRMKMAMRDGKPLLEKKDLEMPFPYDNEVTL